jgi:predicted dehydrogenase
MTGRYATALFGCGRVGAGYAADPVMARHYPYASHTQVLADHPAFDWRAAIDTDAAVARSVAERHGLAVHGTDAAFDGAAAIEVAVLAVPPGARAEIVEALPALRAVVVEKPLGATVPEAEQFLTTCRARGIAVQVNLPRRADRSHRALAAGGLFEKIGAIQGAFLVYGNGLANNATHMVDLVRMLIDEVAAVQVPAGLAAYREGPLDGDVNIPFVLRLISGVAVMAQPLAFGHFRENALDMWGERGRLAILQEGLRIACYPRVENRAMSGEREVASDAPDFETSTVGNAFRAIYDDLADALATRRPPVSSGESALTTARVIDAVRASAISGDVQYP